MELMTKEQYIEQVAAVCHAVNRAYCQALGDHSQPDWQDAPEWQKQSARNGVQFHLDNPEAGPDASHKSWLTEKLADGWRRGDVKDADRKLHPCMVPFVDLPVEQQAKDFIFRAVVHALGMPTIAEPVGMEEIAQALVDSGAAVPGDMVMGVDPAIPGEDQTVVVEPTPNGLRIVE